MRCLISWVVLTCLSVPSAEAQPSPAQRPAFLEVHIEVIQCSAYFNLLAACMMTRPDRSGTADVSQRLQGQARDFFQLGAETGTRIGLTVDAITSRYQHERSEMMRLTRDQPCENAASLFVRWRDMCAAYAEDPVRAMTRHLR
ncbi:MAG: hypothetical protein JWO26_1901 [Rhodospirillales bacterium]|nr:hypothetical protein [Rhodospirillales bacterium]